MILRNSFDTKKWAKDNFAGCDLEDVRRSNRLVKLASQVVHRPSASLPKIGED